MYGHYVGDLQDAGFLPLQVVAALWLKKQHEYICHVADGGIALTGADRLDQYHVEAEHLQEPHHRAEVCNHSSEARCGRQAADEDALVLRPGRHAKAVAKKRAAAQGALRVASEHRDARAFATQQFDELADKRALADAAASGKGDDATSRLRLPKSFENLFYRFAACHLAQQPRQGPT